MSHEPLKPEEPTDAAARRLETILAEHRDPEGAQSDEMQVETDAVDAGAIDAFDPFDPFAPAPSPSQGSPADAGHHIDHDADPEADPEAEPDETVAGDDLPDAPLFALLRSLERDVGVDRIDRIWVFPPRRVQSGETSVVVISAFPEIDSDRRRVYAARYTAREDAREATLAIDEFGTAPTDRVERLAEEVVERIKEGPPAAPRSHHIDGSDDRWAAVLHALAESHLDAVQKDSRLRR